jgi:hypothetical protein
MSDQRSVVTDALHSLGTINIPDDSGRDAIHLAVEPCIATEVLYPGQHVGFVDGKVTASAPKKLGIVDPFINGSVPVGGRFWFIVYPRQITSLRHVWSHPDFEEGAKKKVAEESEAWLRAWCGSHDVPDYDTVMAAVQGHDISRESDDDYYGGRSYSDDGDSITFYGIDAHCEIPNEFWDHVENVTGRKFSQRANYFSCSC